MNFVKNIIRKTTGYWIHKLSTLPIGADMFYDISKRLGYGNLETVFDVGANEGQTIRWIKHHQPAASIYSFEPVRQTFDILKKNTAGLQNCIIENMALGEEAGETEIKLFDDFSVLNSLKPGLMNTDAAARTETIRIERLDTYCAKKSITKIDLLKIDTEGYELNVLDGAGHMLREGNISFVYCETGFTKSNKRNTNFSELSDYLAAKDYFFYALYQVDAHDWKNGNHLANALFIHKRVFP